MTNILIVDDNINFNINFNINLDLFLSNDDDIKILKAFNATNAINLLITKKIDIVVLDLDLPDLPGKEILKKLCNNNKYNTIPVIIVSAHITLMNDIKNFPNIFEIFLKPINYNVFYQTIKNIILNQENITSFKTLIKQDLIKYKLSTSSNNFDIFYDYIVFSIINNKLNIKESILEFSKKQNIEYKTVKSKIYNMVKAINKQNIFLPNRDYFSLKYLILELRSKYSIYLDNNE